MNIIVVTARCGSQFVIPNVKEYESIPLIADGGNFIAVKTNVGIESFYFYDGIQRINSYPRN